jgi:hypothetical protein
MGRIIRCVRVSGKRSPAEMLRTGKINELSPDQFARKMSGIARKNKYTTMSDVDKYPEVTAARGRARLAMCGFSGPDEVRKYLKELTK